MPIWLVFLLLTSIASLTPLAIQWSLAEVGYQFAVTARMAIGAMLFLLLIPWLKKHPAPPKQIWILSLIGGGSLFLTIFCIYWGARFVPSGFIAVLSGLSPILTGLLTAIWLKEPFTPSKLLGSLLGVGGLMLFFLHEKNLGDLAPIGIAAIMLAVIIEATGIVAIKHWNKNISSLWVTAGSIWVAFPLFLITLLLSDTPWPTEISLKSAATILYLGIVTTGVGFLCFYYLLSQVSAAHTTLVSLTAPALSLWIGATFNQEVIEGEFILGTLLILGGLSLFHWDVLWLNRRTPV